MIKNKFHTIVDLGSSNLRLGVFDENLNKLYFSSKNIIQKNNNEEQFNTIKFLIKDAEKNISNHIDNIVVMYDSSEIHSIDISIKKNYDKKISLNDVYSSTILELNQLVKNNYVNKKIIHIISSKIIIDGEELNKSSYSNIKAKSVILEVKFFCLPLDKFNQIINIFKKNNLQVLNFFCSSYIK